VGLEPARGLEDLPETSRGAFLDGSLGLADADLEADSGSKVGEAALAREALASMQ
jgi:hypothetical protein